MAKKALCIGINHYPNLGSDLSGCLNDAAAWGELLEAAGYSVHTLLDSAAKRVAVLQELAELVLNADRSDSLFITFSGHGTQVPDNDGDEPDGLDEALCCYDCYSGGLVYDDELWALFRAKHHSSTRIVLVSDSCHSGTVARRIGPPIALPVVAGRRRYVPHQLLAPEVVAAHWRAAARPEALDNALQRHRLVEEGGLFMTPDAKVKWPVLLLSGCQDNEYSYDATIGGRPIGAMTHFATAALKQLAAGPSAPTYNEWFVALRTKLPNSQFPQTPRMIGAGLHSEVFS